MPAPQPWVGAHLRHNLHPKFPVKTGSCFLLHDLHDIRPRLVSSFFMSCFHLALTGFSGRKKNFFFFSKQGLLCNGSALAFQSCASLDVDHRLQGSQTQQLWPTGLVALGHLQSSQARSQMHILSTGSKGKALWKEFEINHFYMKLGTMAYLGGD